MQLQRSGGELVEGRRELKAVLEERHPGEDVQAQSGSGHGHHQTPHVPEGGRGGGEKGVDDEGEADKKHKENKREKTKER